MLGRKAGFEGLPTDFSARLALSRHRPNDFFFKNFFPSIFHTLYLGATQWCKFEIVTQKSSVDRERALTGIDPQRSAEQVLTADDCRGYLYQRY